MITNKIYIIMLVLLTGLFFWFSCNRSQLTSPSENNDQYTSEVDVIDDDNVDFLNEKILYDIWIRVIDNNGSSINGIAFQTVYNGEVLGTLYSGESVCGASNGIVGLNDQGYPPSCDWPPITSENTYKIVPCSGSSYLVVGFGVNGPDYDVVATYNIDTGMLTINSVHQGSTAEVVYEALPCEFRKPE